MPDLKKKPGEMEFIGGNGGKNAMFKSVKQELTGDDGKSGALSDLWIIGAIVVGLCIVFMIIVMVIRMIKKGDKNPKRKDEEESEEGWRTLTADELYDDLKNSLDEDKLEELTPMSDEEFRNDLIELGLSDEDYDGDYSEFYPPAPQLTEEEKQELRQQLEAEIASLDAQIDELVAEIGGFDKDWTDEQIKEHEAMLNMVGELREQHFELLSEEEKAEVREWMEKEAEYLKDLYGIREELEELDEGES